MQAPALPLDEDQRLSALYALKILDTLPEDRFDRLTLLAKQVFDVPIALISFVDADRQWFKSCQGLSFSETSREISFCGHTILDSEPLIIPDTLKDERFSANPLVAGEPHIRFYAGCPVAAPDGSKVGSLCVKDTRPRHLDREQIGLLQHLAALVEDQLNLVGITAFQKDFEQRASDALQKSADRFYALVQHSTDIITILDSDGTIRYESPAIEPILGYSPEELVGQNAFRFVHPDDLSNVGGHVERSLSNPGVPISVDFRFRHKDGSWRYLSSTGRNLLDNPAVAGLVINSRDVTEQKEIEERAHLQDKLAAVGQLAAGIAHDFNNLLTVMIGVSQLVERQKELPDTVREDMRSIYQQGQRAALLVRQILDFSRKMPAERQPIQLQSFLKEFFKLLERTLPEHIQIALDLTPENISIEANLTQLQQVLTNLVVNARDAMPRGGQLHIGLSRRHLDQEDLPALPNMQPGEWIVWTVSDTGTGMTAEVKQRIFEPFFTTKPQGQGTGLGLAQVYGIVKQHKGYIEVESQPGEGTTFTIYLPPLHEEGAALGLVEAATLKDGRGQTVLVVENEPTVLKTTIQLLESLHYQPIAALGGEEALRILAERSPSIALVLTDFIMPGLSGREWLARLQASYPQLPVVVMSGYPLSREGFASYPEGIAGQLVKPLYLETLSSVLAGVLEES